MVLGGAVDGGSVFQRSVAGEGSGLLHSAGRGQLGVSAGADKTSGASLLKGFRAHRPSAEFNHASGLARLAHEPQVCLIHMLRSDWTVYFTLVQGRAALFLSDAFMQRFLV